jgi:hypothetical protein
MEYTALAFVRRLVFWKLENTTLRKLDLLSSSCPCDVIEVRDPTERCLPLHLRTETDPVYETLYSQVSKIKDDGQSPRIRDFL